MFKTGTVQQEARLHVGWMMMMMIIIIIIIFDEEHKSWSCF
jgi:hypothetical protein